MQGGGDTCVKIVVDPHSTLYIVAPTDITTLNKSGMIDKDAEPH